MVYFLKQKSAVLSTFKKFHKQAEQILSCKLEVLQTDGGGEFKALKAYLRSYGIVHRFFCPHTSKQNELVERKHRQIMKTGLSMLAHASLLLLY